jgi:uncharacterized membrane protein YgcG
LGLATLAIAIGVAACSGAGSSPAISPAASAAASRTVSATATPTAVATPTPVATATPIALPVAGPPYPNPATDGRGVYDGARIFTGAAATKAEHTIATLDARTGLTIVVYTQIKPASDTLDKANADALALINQWKLDRNALVIMFDMEANMVHGKVSLYAASGARAKVPDATRQAIFDNDMLPLLKRVPPDFDGALAVALKDIDTAIP